MNITQLQKQIELLTDQINDIFHATQLNFDAIKIHLQIKDQPNNNHFKSSKLTSQQKITNTVQQKSNSLSKPTSIILQCQKQYEKLKSSYKQRSNLRLQYLINQQIKSQQQKVRKQRLLQYEDKIYDHRRLICDKQSFYDTMLKPKIKKPAGMSTQQFQQMRYKQMQKQQKENFQQLEEQTQTLLKLQKMLRKHRLHLEEQFDKYKKGIEQINKQLQAQELEEMDQQQEKNIEQIQDQQNHQHKKELDKNSNVMKKDSKTNKSNQIKKYMQSKQKLIESINSTPVLYESAKKTTNLPQLSINQKASSLQSIKCLLKKYTNLSQSQQQILKQYNQQKQMYKYLKWQQQQLIKKYKKLDSQIKQLKKESSNFKRQLSLNIRNKTNHKVQKGQQQEIKFFINNDRMQVNKNNDRMQVNYKNKNRMNKQRHEYKQQ